MKSVNKVVRAEIEALLRDVVQRAGWVREEVTKFDAAVAELQRPVLDMIGLYNESIEGLNEAIDLVREAVEDYRAARSQRWQEGEAAQRYDDWMVALEGARIETLSDPESLRLDIEMVDPVDPFPLSLAEAHGDLEDDET